MVDPKVEWIIGRHVATNHMYDTYLPYEFHLRMVVKLAEDYSYLITDPEIKGATYYNLIYAAWGHDLIEDTRTSYNDCVKYLNKPIADLIYALTNEKGHNRAERGNDKYYEGIRNTEGAVFLKLCDRIANVQYSKMSGSGMFDAYEKENDSFLEKMGYVDGHRYQVMFQYLIDLFQ